MNKILVFAGMTHRSNIRQKIFITLFIFSLAMMGGMFLFPALVPGADEKSLVDMAFACMELLAFFMVLFSLSFIFYKEMENKTVLLDLTKPVLRRDYLLGKILGTVLTVAWGIGYMSAFFFLILGIRGMSFYPNYFAAILFIFLEMILLSSIALFFSVFTTSLASSFLFSFVVFILGHGSQQIKGFAKQLHNNPVASSALQALYYLLPNLDYFNVKDKMAETAYFLTLPYCAEVLCYSLLYSALVTVFACLSFRKRDF